MNWYVLIFVWGARRYEWHERSYSAADALFTGELRFQRKFGLMPREQALARLLPSYGVEMVVADPMPSMLRQFPGESDAPANA